jgi:hypothetical protein
VQKTVKMVVVFHALNFDANPLICAFGVDVQFKIHIPDFGRKSLFRFNRSYFKFNPKNIPHKRRKYGLVGEGFFENHFVVQIAEQNAFEMRWNNAEVTPE